MIYYYLTVSPVESLIASQLTPEDFGMYMATGSEKGNAEQLMFIEVEGGFGDWFDWKFAEQNCRAHSDGRPKHSLYLSIYRVLEHTPLENMKSLYLVTKDGRSLRIEKSQYSETGDSAWRGYALYKELCPVTPLVVSSLKPNYFGRYMVDSADKVTVPTLVFADVKVIDLDDIENTGNVGHMYDRNTQHLRSCIEDLRAGRGKKTKTVDRSFENTFSYQIINTGIFVAGPDGLAAYFMPPKDKLQREFYDWSRSAMIF